MGCRPRTCQGQQNHLFHPISRGQSMYAAFATMGCAVHGGISANHLPSQGQPIPTRQHMPSKAPSQRQPTSPPSSPSPLRPKQEPTRTVCETHKLLSCDTWNQICVSNMNLTCLRRTGWAPKLVYFAQHFPLFNAESEAEILRRVLGDWA